MLMASICPLRTQSSRKRWKKISAPCLFIEIYISVILILTCMLVCYLHDSELSLKVCASLRTVPGWINKIWYNLRTVPSQWTISDGEKWNLTPASIENTHTHSPWVVALCCLCSLVILLGFFFSVNDFVQWWMCNFLSLCVMTGWKNMCAAQALHTCPKSSCSSGNPSPVCTLTQAYILSFAGGI